MTNYNEIAQRYIDAWNEADPDARRTKVNELYTDDARYIDPLAEAEGRDAIEATIAAVQQQFPGFVFQLAGPVDGHHNQARFGWELGPAGEPAPIVGFDVAVTDATGRIQTVLGFLDKVPAAAG
jgi:SnoaL-like protein